MHKYQKKTINLFMTRRGPRNQHAVFFYVALFVCRPLNGLFVAEFTRSKRQNPASASVHPRRPCHLCVLPAERRRPSPGPRRMSAETPREGKRAERITRYNIPFRFSFSTENSLFVFDARPRNPIDATHVFPKYLGFFGTVFKR